ncbi:hypothetical protein QQX98_005402 [Neonectria punicea]|uniref:Uncharacterized protein n=1 Tax=Neonectria punicea TaxID=979145 RepID=A0ABR1H578_9HYPO
MRQLTVEEKNHVQQAIFAVLCWTSAILTPVVGEEAILLSQSTLDVDALDEEASLSVAQDAVLFAKNYSHTYSTTELRRPTGKIFHSYRLRADDTNNREHDRSDVSSPTITPQAPGYHFEDMLYEPSLNYGSLSVIGHVKIKWVDTLTAHLAFEHATQELPIYRYPSFCATKIMSLHRVKFFESITETLLPSHHFVHDKDPASIYRETILSYCLLFGQSHKSRQILSQLPDGSPRNSRADPPQLVRVANTNGFDPFLKVLCTLALHPRRSLLGLLLKKKSSPRIRGDLVPKSALNLSDELIESDTNSAREDFPTFGPRFLALQRYNMRRQPSGMTDLWRDRRKPLQWYTFWAVLCISRAGILLALLQLVVSVIQTVYAIHPTS